jgi:hypothetical protein
VAKQELRNGSEVPKRELGNQVIDRHRKMGNGLKIPLNPPLGKGDFLNLQIANYSPHQPIEEGEIFQV